MQSALTELEDIKDAEVSLQTGNALVYYSHENVSIQEMKKAVESAGFSVSGHSTPKKTDKNFSEKRESG